MTKLYFFWLVAFLVSVTLLVTTAAETRLDSACETNPFMNMKKPPRFGKRSQSFKDIFSQFQNFRMARNGMARRSSGGNFPLLCVWPPMQRRSAALAIDSAENIDRNGRSNINPEQNSEN